MDATRIGIILVKLGAVFLLVSVLQDINGFLAYFEFLEERKGLVIFSLTMVVVLPLLIVAVLWFFPATLVGKLSADSADTVRLDTAAGATLVGVTLVALYALVFGLVDLFYYESVRYAEASFAEELAYLPYRPSTDTIVGRYTNVFQIFVGLVLLLGRRGISQTLAAARGRGKVSS